MTGSPGRATRPALAVASHPVFLSMNSLVSAAGIVPRSTPGDPVRFGRSWAAIPWAVLAIAVMGSVIWPRWSGQYAAWPFLISAAVLGMPHGALDLRLAMRVRVGWSGRAVLAGVYLAVSAAAFALLWWLPLPTIVAFGLLSVVHFGMADARDAAMIAGHAPPRGGALWMTAWGRGVFLLSLPFAWDPVGAMLPVEVALDLLGRDDVAYSESMVSRGGTLCAGLGLLAVAAGVWREKRRAAVRVSPQPKGGSWGRLLTIHGGELALLSVASALLAPMFFVGLYFLGWHALRHLRRAAVLSGDRPGKPVRTIAHQHAWSLPLLLPTLAAYALIGHAAIGWTAPMQWAVLLLLTFVVLTPPHHLLVEQAIALRRACATRD